MVARQTPNLEDKVRFLTPLPKRSDEPAMGLNDKIGRVTTARLF